MISGRGPVRTTPLYPNGIVDDKARRSPHDAPSHCTHNSASGVCDPIWLSRVALVGLILTIMYLWMDLLVPRPGH